MLHFNKNSEAWRCPQKADGGYLTSVLISLCPLYHTPLSFFTPHNSPKPFSGLSGWSSKSTHMLFLLLCLNVSPYIMTVAYILAMSPEALPAETSPPSSSSVPYPCPFPPWLWLTLTLIPESVSFSWCYPTSYPTASQPQLQPSQSLFYYGCGCSWDHVWMAALVRSQQFFQDPPGPPLSRLCKASITKYCLKECVFMISSFSANVAYVLRSETWALSAYKW